MEKIAKKEMKGLWSLCPNMNISPKEWKKGKGDNPLSLLYRSERDNMSKN